VDINGPAYGVEPTHWHIALAAEHVIDGALVPDTLTFRAEVV
jgi:phosphate transport system substrate-binding protein